jgi:uncharacterized protein YdeI (YjbR/CyaY-like superfamily)
MCSTHCRKTCGICQQPTEKPNCTLPLSYLAEAVEIEKAGLKVPFKPANNYTIPAEFQHKIAEVAALEKAFQALTPGRQRAYLLYFSAPKQAATRASRVEKFLLQILQGKGLNE